MKRQTILSILTFLLLVSCSRELPETVFRTLDTAFCEVATRSLLTAPNIETKKTSVTLAAYAGGTLAVCQHYTTALDAMALELDPGLTYTLYALVNMGDMTASIPRSESDLASLTYRIPSYTQGSGSLAARGLPMAGTLDYPGHGTVIPVERLLAKVTAHLSCEWEDAAIQSVRVCNLNRVLRPFDEAVMDEDWDQQEFDDGAGTASGTFVFYVPENRQGTIGGIRTPREKSPDKNDEVRARSEWLTYLETTVEGTGAIVGTIVYRSYLGRNAVTDFDIRRNARYDWTLRFLQDGLQYDDWKHDNDLIDAQTGLHISDGWDDGGETDLH